MPRPLRALLVEDSEDDALLVARELRKSNFAPETLRVETRLAMEAALDQRVWDIVIADYSLPHFSAVAALDLLRERGLDLPFIVVSGAIGEETAVAALRAGAHDFLVKGNWARLGPAIERELHEAANRRERARANRALLFLAEASRDLSGSLDVETTLQRVTRLGVPELADLCVLDLDDEHGNLRRGAVVQAVHLDPSLARSVSLLSAPASSSDHPVAVAHRTGRTQLLADLSEEGWFRLRGHDQVGPIEALKLRSLIAVPLLARGRVLGVLSFARGADRPSYDAADVALAEELAWRAALAIDNARLYAAERHARAEAEKAVHLRDEFLSIAAHELKTPITSLRANAQLMLRRLDRGSALDEERVIRAFQLIDQQSDKLAQLIAQLLDISRLEAGKLSLDRRETDLVALVEGLADGARARTDIHTVAVRAPDRLTADVDPLRLEQVLTNLIDNAIKYSPSGGEIEIDLDLAPNDEVRIIVRDHGIGIPAERRAHIFDRFYQAHVEPALGGLGLGLHISRQIVELHGGTLSAEFPPEGGSRFVVNLPRRGSAEQSAASDEDSGVGVQDPENTIRARDIGGVL